MREQASVEWRLLTDLTSEQHRRFEELVEEFGAADRRDDFAPCSRTRAVAEWPIVVADWTANLGPPLAGNDRPPWR
jgi:hypothetical protein